MKPKVSVIIPLYNHEDFVEDAIRSVLKQTYPNFELIIINDGSTDDSHRKVEEYLRNEGMPQNCKFIKFEKNEDNQGISYARNRGIKHSSGTHIAFLSSDDIWEPNFLERMVEIHQKNSIVFCDFIQISVNGGIMRKDKFMESEVPIKFKIESFKNKVFSKAKTHGMFVNYSCIFGKKKFFTKKYGFLDKIRYGEDLYHLLKVVGVANFIYLPEFLVKYRHHKDSITQKNHHQIHNNNKKIFTHLREEGYEI